MVSRRVIGPPTKIRYAPKLTVPPRTKVNIGPPQIRTEISETQLYESYMNKYAYMLHVRYNEHDRDISEDYT